ncbi:patatin-like phospholipase : Uncharacterized protein OS=Cystobacter violaceus Cb vi76 GN=Q664_48110 PE=4 SV=1: Patatin [Gemmata massiliana]|uniref:PNPLA domain-containing protein n=1 Tax=Gemmata massiliana TaxID=1210884 RepID=A0A6P2DBB0_9BACT|nr:patatin-like phospholipase family protein [Gemmata massiliana]VTR98431.1 patatin-like phospholipase : Uncharacterized protein OS=Cystobacter violaceus Cb vi76 GN=Q664_48110 PE=4 SV=1: Patatin [Gemmata massiliana]
MSDGTLGDRLDAQSPAPSGNPPEADRGFPDRITDAIERFVHLFDYVSTPFRSSWLYCGIERRIRWLIGNPLLSGQIALYLAIAWGVVGSELGLTDLFWHENAWSQFWVGVGTSWLFGTVLFVNILLRGFAPDRLPDSPTETAWWRWWVFTHSLFPSLNPGIRRVGQWMFYWLTGLFVILYLVKVLAIEVGQTFTTGAGSSGWQALPYRGLLFCAGYFSGFVAIYLLSLFDAAIELREAVARRGWLVSPEGVVCCAGDPEPAPAPQPGEPGFHRYHTLRLLHAMAISLGSAILATLAGVVIWIGATGGLISPAILLSLLLMLLDVLGGMIAFRVRGARTLGTGLLLLVALSNWNAVVRNKMTYPDIVCESGTYTYTRGSELLLNDSAYQNLPPNGELIGGEDFLVQFKNHWQKPPGQPPRTTKPRLVVVAVSGGGIRAAVWTAVVLEGLEERFGGNENPNIRDHIRIFAGASGGMVGAAAYVGDFDAGPLPQGRRDDAGLLPFSRALAADSLTPVVQTMILRDFTLSTLLPLRSDVDRGRTLEEAWDQNFKREEWRGGSPFAKKFVDLRGNKQQKTSEWGARRPALIFAPVMVEDSKRLFVSNLDLAPLTAPNGHRLDTAKGAGTTPLSRPGVEFFRLFPKADNFKLGSAARMSATFPVVSPAVSLPVNPQRRVVDAGYFDNYGIDVLANWLLHHQKAVVDNTSGVLLIQIRAYPLEKDGLGFPSQPQSPIDLIIGAVSAPLQAVLTARGSAAYHRNNELLAELHRVFNTGAQPKLCTHPDVRSDFFTTVTFEQQKDAALSWYLTAPQKKQVVEGFYHHDAAKGWVVREDEENNVERKLNAITDWFKKP